MGNDFWSSIGTEATFITPTEKEGSNSLLSERFRTVSALNPRFAAEYKEECPVCGNDEGFVEKSDGDVCCPNCGTSVFEVPDFGDGDPNLSFAGSRRTAATISDMYDSIDEYDPDHIAICYVCDEHFLLGDAERDGNDFMCPNCESSDISVGYTSVSDWSAQQAERQQLGLTGSRRTAAKNWYPASGGSPWGAVQLRADSSSYPGVYQVETAGHGGIFVPNKYLSMIPVDVQKVMGAQWSGSVNWYEEDDGATAPLAYLSGLAEEWGYAPEYDQAYFMNRVRKTMGEGATASRKSATWGDVVHFVGGRDYSIDIEEGDPAKGGYWVREVYADRTGGISAERELKWFRSLDAAKNFAQRFYDKEMARQRAQEDRDFAGMPESDENSYFASRRNGQRKRASLFDDANAAYRRRDQGWFNSLSMDDLLTLWKAVSGENFFTGLQTYAWDDEVYDALYDKGYDFDANRRTTASRRTVAADDGGIYCSKCKGRQVVNMGGVWRNCTKCKGSGLNKKRIPKDVMDIIGEGSLHSVASRTCRTCDKPISRGEYCCENCKNMDRLPAPRDDRDTLTKRRTAAMIQENQYVRVVKPFDLVAYRPDEFGLTLVSRTTKPGEVLLYLGERPGPGSDSVPMYAVRGLTDQIWFEQGWAPKFLNPDNGFVEMVDIGRYASHRVADMSVGFQCLECGAKFKNPKRKCSKCGSYDIDLDPNYKAKSASQVTTAAGDKRRGRGRRKFVPRPSDKHPFDNEPDDYLDTIEDRYGSRAPQGSGRRVAARFVVVENESGKGDWLARAQFGGHTYELRYEGGGPVSEPEIDFQHFHSYVVTCDGKEVLWPSSTASDAYYDAMGSFNNYLTAVWRGADPFTLRSNWAKERAKRIKEDRANQWQD